MLHRLKKITAFCMAVLIMLSGMPVTGFAQEKGTDTVTNFSSAFSLRAQGLEIVRLELSPRSYVMAINTKEVFVAKKKIGDRLEEIDSGNCVWSSDDESIATVDENGVVTGRAVGMTQIHCVYNAGTQDELSTYGVVTVTDVQYKLIYVSGYPEDAKKYNYENGKHNEWNNPYGASVGQAQNTRVTYAYAPNSTTKIEENIFSLINYRLTGYKDEMGKLYRVGEKITIDQPNTTLTAQWEKIQGESTVDKVYIRCYQLPEGGQYNNAYAKATIINEGDSATVTFITGNVQDWLGDKGDHIAHVQEIKGWSINGEFVAQNEQISTTAHRKEGNLWAIDVYPVLEKRTNKTAYAQFYVRKVEPTDKGNVTAIGNYHAVGSGIIDISTFKRNDKGNYSNNTYAGDDSGTKNVEQYIIEAPSLAEMANLMNTTLEELSSIRWYVVKMETNGWHVDGVIYTDEKYHKVEFVDPADGNKIYKTVLVEEWDRILSDDVPTTTHSANERRIFKGWGLQPNCSDEDLLRTGDAVRNKLGNIMEDKVLYAQYQLLDGYTIKYLEKGTGKKIAEEINTPNEHAVGTQINAADHKKTIVGYTYDSCSAESITVQSGAENVIELYYTKRTDIPYKVEFYYENANDNNYTLGKTENRTGIYMATVSITDDDKKENKNGAFIYDEDNPNKKDTIVLDDVADINLTTNILKLYFNRNKVDINVTKTWDDDNDRDKLRKAATEFTIALQANVEGADKSYSVLTWSENGNTWTGKINNVPTHTLDGTPIEYTVWETTCNGYEKSGTEKITPANENERVVALTNKHTPDQVTICAQKVWDDQNDKYSLRPASIKVGLFANDELTENQAILDGTTTSVSWSVNKNDANGRPITYTVRELKADNTGYNSGDEITLGNGAIYTVGYASNAEGTEFTITNTLKTMNITGEKEWVLQGVDLTAKPEVEVTLYYSSVSVATTEIVNDSYTFVDVPYRTTGYTVQETSITGGSITVMNASGVSDTVDAAQYFNKQTVGVNEPTATAGRFAATAENLVNTLTVPTTNEQARAIRVTKKLNLNGVDWPDNMPYPSFTFTASWNGGQATFPLTPVGDEPTATSEQIIVPANAEVTVTEEQVSGWTADAVSKTISKNENAVTFTNTRSVLSVPPSVEKKWIDEAGKEVTVNLPTASVQLYRRVEGSVDEEAMGAKVDLSTSQTYTVPPETKLPSHNEAGQAYSYFFHEVGVVDNKVTLGDKTYDVTESTEGLVTTITNKLNVGVSPTKRATLPENKSNVKPGDVVTYTITRYNHHNEPATVVITDTLGEGLTYIETTSVTVGGTNVTVKPTITANTVVWDFGETKVPAGANVIVVYTVRVGNEAYQVNELTNTASVNLNHEETSSFTTTTANIPTEDHPALTITKTAIDRTKVYQLNDKVVYDIVVTNSGNVTLTDVKVNDAKIGASFILNGNAYTVKGNDALIGTMEKGTSVTVKAEYTVTEEDIKQGRPLTNTATVTGKYNNVEYSASATENVNLETLSCDYTLEKSVKEDRVYLLNETVPFTITVTNTGNQTLTNFVLTEQLAGATILDAQGKPKQLVTISELAPKEIKTFNALYTVAQADLGRTDLKNTVKSTCTEISEEKTADVPFRVEQVMQVEVTKAWECNGVVLNEYPEVTFTLYGPDGKAFATVSTPKAGTNTYVLNMFHTEMVSTSWRQESLAES